MKIQLFLIILFCTLGSASYAQSGKRSTKKQTPSSMSSGSDYKYEKGSEQRIFREDKGAGKPYAITWADQKKKEYDKRMEANAKKYREMEKQMKKPQYSDPSYFGHKSKPKKRANGKKKFCKECGIRH
jgi:hypothetical protein